MNDWTPAGKPRPPQPSSLLLACLQDRPFRQRPIAVAPSAAGHAPSHLKNPRTVNGDSVPSLTSSVRARSHHCRALSSLLYICSVHHLLLLIASPRRRISCFHLFLCPRTLSSLSAPSPVRCTCAGWSLPGRSRKCFCAEQRGRGEPSRHLTNIS